jgi:hypothetical protein
MVREYDRAPAPNLVLVVEPWLPASPSAAAEKDLEAALCLAATIAVVWRRAFECPVTIGVPGSAVATARSEDGVRMALAPLADIAGTATPAPIPADAFDRHLAQSGARVVVSSRADATYAGALRRATGRSFASISPHDRLPWYQPPDAASGVSS